MVSSADLAGVHVALATPVSADGELDRQAMHKLLDRVITGGVMGVCPTGSTGEGPRLTATQRIEVCGFVREVIGPDRLLLPAAAAMNADAALSEIDDLVAAGANAVLLAPPSYFPMSAADVGDYYTRIAEAAAVPIVLYNIPPMTKIAIPAPVVGELAGLPGVIGIKDSSRDFEYLQAVLYATAASDVNFAVLTGSDSMLLPSLQVGAVGTIAASANLVPQLGRAVYDAVAAGDLDGAKAAQRRLYEVIMVCRTGTPPAGWKAALAWAGVCTPDLVPPGHRLDDDQLAALAARLEELDLEV